MSAYAMLAQRKYPKIKKFKCRFDFVRHGGIVETERNLSDIGVTEKYLIKKIETILDAVEQNNFPANPGHFCDFCGHVGRCPIEPDDVLTGEEIASQVLILQALLKDRRERLKKIVSKKGPIAINNVVFDFYLNESEHYPVDKFVEILTEHQVDNPFRYLKVASDQLKYLEPQIMDKLIPLAKSKIFTRFGHKIRREK